LIHVDTGTQNNIPVLVARARRGFRYRRSYPIPGESSSISTFEVRSGFAMRSFFRVAAVCLAAASYTSPARAGEFLSAGLTGNVQNTTSGPLIIQIGPATTTGTLEGNSALNGAPGSFTSYSASPGLPQLTGGDLSKYGFALYGTATSMVGNVDTFSGTFRLYAPGYGYTVNDGDILEHGTFTGTVTFSDPDHAVVFGTFLADPGTLQPPGWPVPVDFSPANPLELNGTYTSTAAGEGILVATLATIPEPGSLSLAIVCLGGLTIRSWRKRLAA
jgi:hypothetical protein